jgi:ABC-2 type transport system permease protein
LTAASVLSVVPVMFLVSFGLTSLGLVIAWRLDSTQGFHAIMNLILLPMWVLSGAFFPTTGVPAWLGWTMRLNPLTYGMAALRRSLYLGNPTAAGALPGMAPALGITLAFCVLAFVAAAVSARRSPA